VRHPRTPGISRNSCGELDHPPPGAERLTAYTSAARIVTTRRIATRISAFPETFFSTNIGVFRPFRNLDEGRGPAV
jgi:hypothetical protein